MAGPRYAIKLKSLNRYNYRGVLYKFKDEKSFERLHYAVTRELRDHLVSTGYFEDVRSVEPTPIAPEPVAEPEAIVEADLSGEATSEAVTEIKPAAEPAPGNDMSRESLGISKQYGAKREPGIEV